VFRLFSSSSATIRGVGKRECAGIGEASEDSLKHEEKAKGGPGNTGISKWYIRPRRGREEKKGKRKAGARRIRRESNATE